MVFDLLLLLCGLALLNFGADHLIHNSLLLAKKYVLPPIIVGFVIVGFGTSLPEFFINVSASVHQNKDIIFGNVIGSDVFNLLGILGIVAFIYPISLKRPNILYEFPILIIISLLIWPLSYFIQNQFGPLIGILFLILFVGFLFYLFLFYRNKMEDINEDPEAMNIVSSITPSASKLYLNLLWSFILLFGGGELVVMYTIALGHSLGIPQHILALTVVAIGSSLPELMASIAAARKQYTDLVVGNILGSNIFNILFILGVSFIIHPVQFDVKKFFVAIILIIFFSLYYIFIGMVSKKSMLTSKTAYFPIAVYVLYVIYLIVST